MVAAEDPYLWLEDVDSDRALGWVRERNAITQGELAGDPSFEPLRSRLLSILDSDERIPALTERGGRYYNFWRDEDNPRGLWRRTTLAQYRRPEPRWETVLDIDQLAEEEGENWVYKRVVCDFPDGERCLLHLSRGGADAVVVREFDTTTRSFVEGGFELPEAKTQVAWRDRDHLFVATDFGPGTLTRAGYARQVRLWERGTPLSEATLLREAEETDNWIAAYREHAGGASQDVVYLGHTFFSNEMFVEVGDGEEWVRLDKPDDADASFWGDQVILTLRTEWTVGDTTYPGGSVLMSELAAFLEGERTFVQLFEPSERTAFRSITRTQNRVLVTELEDVQTRIYAWGERRGEWTRERIHADVDGTQRVSAVDDAGSDEYWHWTSGFLTPSRYSLGSARDRLQRLRQEPAFFDAEGLTVDQHFATSADGTRVPYFQVSREEPAPDAPTVLYGYGGFEIALTASYSATVGAGWLERGGTYVVANIRGGGEYGPRWHQAALRHNRQRAYDDFIAVAEDLIERGVTTPARLGIHGGSNGGLLMGVMLTQRPELFGAIVCEVPLLDMRRYHRLLAGASWMEEYGDPDDPDDWAALSAFSPYQNVDPDATYPPTLFLSSTRDDRVHPGHGRKMVARMLESDQPVRYFENIEGGHGGASNNAQYAYKRALAYLFFERHLRVEGE